MKKLLLIGKSGSGKTTIVNQLCHKNIPTFYGGNRSTKQEMVYRLDNVHLLIDTPPFDIKNEDDGSHNFEIIDYFAQLFHKYEVVQILVIVRYQRLADMRNDLQDCIGPLRKFKQFMIVIVTFWDECSNQEIAESQIVSKVKQWFGVTCLFKDDNLMDQIAERVFQQDKNIQFDLSNTIFNNTLNPHQQKFIESLQKLVSKPQNQREAEQQEKSFKIQINHKVQQGGNQQNQPIQRNGRTYKIKLPDNHEEQQVLGTKLIKQPQQIEKKGPQSYSIKPFKSQFPIQPRNVLIKRTQLQWKKK